METSKEELGIVDRLLHRLTNGLDDQLPDDPEFVKRYPFLWDFLRCRVLASGKTKERAELRIRIKEGDWDVTLSDAALRVSYPACGKTVVDGLERLEALLRNPDTIPVRWRKGTMKLVDPPKEKKLDKGS